jgi:hypothetical protein
VESTLCRCLALASILTITAAALQPRHPPALTLLLLKITTGLKGTRKQGKLL